MKLYQSPFVMLVYISCVALAMLIIAVFWYIYRKENKRPMLSDIQRPSAQHKWQPPTLEQSLKPEAQQEPEQK